MGRSGLIFGLLLQKGHFSAVNVPLTFASSVRSLFPTGVTPMRTVNAHDFACDDCGSPAVVYPAVLHEAAQVSCRGCDKVICLYGELKQRVEHLAHVESAWVGTNVI